MKIKVPYNLDAITHLIQYMLRALHSQQIPSNVSQICIAPLPTISKMFYFGSLFCKWVRPE